MRRKSPAQAVAYYRTSSAANVGEDKDSLARQRAAVAAYARRERVEVVAEFYDMAVSGADPVGDRPGFADMLARIEGNGVSLVLVEDPSRFARDLAVQLAGHDLLKRMGVELVAANAPEHFREDTPTAVLVRQVLGAIAQFERAQLVTKLRAARDRKRAKTGRCEGRKPVPPEVVEAARRLSRKPPKGKRPSLRTIAANLEAQGHVGPSGRRYGAESIKRMLATK
ncbi:MAG: recombinase family protein [Kiloniellaceae bacterium]